jgi:uncharacterized protein DUF1573
VPERSSPTSEGTCLTRGGTAHGPRTPRRRLVDFALGAFLLSSLGVCAVAAFQSLARQGGALGPTPTLSCDAPVFDGGCVLQGEPVERVFQLTNVSGEPLTITGLKKSCACSTAELVGGTRTVPAGASTQVRVSIDTKARSRKMFARVRLYTDRRDDPAVVLAIGCHVVRPFQCRPEAVRFGEVGQGTRADRLVEIWCDADDVARIERIDSPSKHVKLEHQLFPSSDAEKGGRTVGALVRVALTEDAPDGSLETSVRVWIKGRTTPIAELPVVARIRQQRDGRSGPSVAAR